MRQADVCPFVSVVICTRNRAGSLGQTLDSIATLDYPEFEVIVVDQSSDQQTQRLVQRRQDQFSRLRYMRLHTPGLSRAYNAGLQAATGALVAFTDDDVVTPPGWLRNIFLAFTAHPHVSLLYGQVLLPPQLLERENVDGVTPSLAIPERRTLDGTHGFQIFGMGANFAARRQLFEEVGGFDEVLGGGGPLASSQDFDFLYRVFKAGKSTLLEPSVVVYHYGFRSYTGEWDATARSYGIGVGGFFFKHVRLGDLYAARLMVGFMIRPAGRVVRLWLSGRPAGVHWTFLASVAGGIRESLRFRIDPRLRVYRVRA